jgi:hypothetical protein
MKDRRAFVTDTLGITADVSANIKNVVSKPATQKILAALAERGEITQKVYGEQHLVFARPLLTPLSQARRAITSRIR